MQLGLITTISDEIRQVRDRTFGAFRAEPNRTMNTGGCQFSAALMQAASTTRVALRSHGTAALHCSLRCRAQTYNQLVRSRTQCTPCSSRPAEKFAASK